MIIDKTSMKEFMFSLMRSQTCKSEKEIKEETDKMADEFCELMESKYGIKAADSRETQ